MIAIFRLRPKDNSVGCGYLYATYTPPFSPEKGERLAHAAYKKVYGKAGEIVALDWLPENKVERKQLDEQTQRT